MQRPPPPPNSSDLSDGAGDGRVAGGGSLYGWVVYAPPRTLSVAATAETHSRTTRHSPPASQSLSSPSSRSIHATSTVERRGS